MRISNRLREIEKFIPYGSILADIGCDHAYLDCLAIQNNRCIKCYACDIAQGPLEMAKKTIQELNCEDRVFPILSNGLENVPSDANVCVISGMGFETMKMILEAKDLSQFDRFIFQANNDVYDLRKWIVSNGFKIIDESMIHEEKQTTCYLMHLCKARKQAMQASSDEVLIQSLPYSLVEQDITISDKVTQFLKYLGYKPQIIAGVTSSEPVPVLIINW